MRQLIFAIGCCVLAAAPAMAFTVADGTEKGLDQAAMTVLADTMLVQFADPSSVQLAKLYQPEPGIICGLVNAKNRQGGYAGFMPFKFFSSRGKIYLGDAARC
ncbi:MULTISPECIES: hypothetical protein [unclassified Rhizobium]|uniref:hypothetical protein n=1 Tax=unclassified Rhizobium TaxID=2613769 RepID=UPI001612EC36|nr:MULTISPECIES: hypothetical protein [unclassified Rhizobium]MBB3288156.1 hypothetical protein [Rhizobium sp. BK252]MBB3402980.1 hypothetical protein [Rhizobium sp. BK289]MBB3415557.1 hypothetical protein [Rhizobium sp. BK284]MBB3483362.1 hypothetical protein [Rhizobium sp. BK347]